MSSALTALDPTSRQVSQRLPPQADKEPVGTRRPGDGRAHCARARAHRHALELRARPDSQPDGRHRLAHGLPRLPARKCSNCHWPMVRRHWALSSSSSSSVLDLTPDRPPASSAPGSSPISSCCRPDRIHRHRIRVSSGRSPWTSPSMPSSPSSSGSTSASSSSSVSSRAGQLASLRPASAVGGAR